MKFTFYKTNFRRKLYKNLFVLNINIYRNVKYKFWGFMKQTRFINMYDKSCLSIQSS